ncbi:uncharacterized protein ATC70_008397 [Mucor velutinosus]|uniref:F-box domain-containing protein n=1 Tax=Mucor velutinosus TaxID=708070 RepID=A0AAN7HPY9_9FUNG|nr:hypothetical protein ATC70_008397 [Mucor velutinosus]
MNKLPLEVALLVSNHLSHREKQEGALTCRSWCTWFRSNGLFEKVSLHAVTEDSADSHSQYLPLLRFFEGTYGKSVVVLSISVNTMKLEDFARLPHIFPNITTLHWVGDIPLNNSKDKQTFEMAVSKWRHIKTIDDGSNRHQISTALLKETSTATQLEDIKLVYPQDSNDCVEFNLEIPLHLASNAHSLTAVNAPFIICTLENNRDAFKQFTTLRLLNLDDRNEDGDDTAYDYQGDIDTDDRGYLSEEEHWRQNEAAELSALIPNVQHLEVTVNPLTFGAYNGVRWLGYFTRTFPNLVSFSFSYPDFMYPALSSTDLADDYLFMHNRWRLKKYSMQFDRISRPTLEVMEEYKVALEDLTVFVDGQSTDQFVFLKESSQTKSLKKLTINEREKYVFNGVYGHTMFQLMEQIPQLEVVEIDTFRGSLLQHNPTVIVSILNSAPQIKALKAPALMSQSSGENALVYQPCELVHLDISYCQFKLTVLGAQNINQTFRNILDKCPSLETFSTQVNAYKDEASTDTNIALVFSFTHQPDMKRIHIESLYETYFKFIVNGKATYYHQKHGDMRRPVPNVDETKVYIQIEARHASIIDTSVMSETP